MKTYLMTVMIFLTGCGLIPKNEGTPVTLRKDIPSQARNDDNGPRKRIILLPIVDHRPQNFDNNEIRLFLTKDLAKSNQLVVITSDELKVDFQSFYKKGEYNLEALAKKASHLGVAALVEAQISEVKMTKKSDEVGVLRQLKTEVEVTVRLRSFSVASQKESFDERKTLSSSDFELRVIKPLSSDKEVEVSQDLVQALLEEAFHSLLPKYLSQLEKTNWEGRIALVKGERLFLNVGRLSGLQIGDILKVVDEGEEVFDPETGLLIGKVPGRLKGTLEVVSYFGQDGTVAVIHSGAGFKENDRIEMY